MGRQCRCGKGYASEIDQKCSHCRTKKEQQAWLHRPQKFLHLKVVNKHHGETGIYIGRGSPLGNPYSHMANTKAQFKTATRDEAIEKYRVWLRQQIDSGNATVINELQRIGNLAIDGPVKLQCFCSPQACHGDVITDVLLKAVAKTYPDYHWNLGR